MAFSKPTHEQLANRFKEHSINQEQLERMAKIRSQLYMAARVCVDLTPCSSEQIRALNALEEAMFLFNVAIARNEPQ